MSIFTDRNENITDRKISQQTCLFDCLVFHTPQTRSFWLVVTILVLYIVIPRKKNIVDIHGYCTGKFHLCNILFLKTFFARNVKRRMTTKKSISAMSHAIFVINATMTNHKSGSIVPGAFVILTRHVSNFMLK